MHRANWSWPHFTMLQARETMTWSNCFWMQVRHFLLLVLVSPCRWRNGFASRPCIQLWGELRVIHPIDFRLRTFRSNWRLLFSVGDFLCSVLFVLFGCCFSHVITPQQSIFGEICASFLGFWKAVICLVVPNNGVCLGGSAGDLAWPSFGKNCPSLQAQFFFSL